MADPIAVKIVVVRPSAVLVETRKGDVHLPVFLAKRMELPQDTAKRVLREVFGLETERVVSLPLISRIAVEDIPESERKTWPKGAKTIPCIAFALTVGEKTEVSAPAYEWMVRSEWEKLPEKTDRMTLDTLA